MHRQHAHEYQQSLRKRGRSQAEQAGPGEMRPEGIRSAASSHCIPLMVQRMYSILNILLSVLPQHPDDLDMLRSMFQRLTRFHGENLMMSLP